MEAGDRILGYTSKPVVHSGSTLQIHAASATPNGENCKLRILRLGWYGGTGARQVAMSDYFHVGYRDFWNPESKTISSSVKNGCDWPEVHSIDIPKDWHSGLYMIRFELEDNSAYLHPFWITNPKPSGLVLLFSTITWQARNWWGGASATVIHKKRPKKVKELYYPIGSTGTSYLRPMYNPRGGDALRWDYPFIRFIERNGIDIEYISDLDVDRGEIDCSKIENLVTTGPAKYLTLNMDSWLKEAVSSGMNYIHLGSEAGQHLVKVESSDFKISTTPTSSESDFGERLENPLTQARISGSKARSPWGDLHLNNGLVIKGIMGTSWDKSFSNHSVNIIGQGQARHRLFSKRKVETQLIEAEGKGTVFNSGCSNWTWALSDFGRQGNIKVDIGCQRLTWKLLGLDENELNIYDDIEEIANPIIVTSKLSLVQLNEIIQTDKKNHDALFSAAVILFNKGQFSDSLTYSERAITLKPDWIQAKYYFARCLYKMKRYEEMVPLYKELLKKSPDKYHYIVQYGQLLIELGHYDEANEVIEGALRLRNDELGPILLKVLGARKQKKFKEAEALLKHIIKREPDNIQALVQHSTIAQETLNFTLAKQRWEKVLELKPNNYYALMGTAKYYLKSNEFEKLEILLKNMVYSPEYGHKFSPYVELINLLTNHQENYPEVIKFCLLAIDNTANELIQYSHLAHVPIINLALSLSKIGKANEAVEMLEERFSMEPTNLEYILCLARIYRELGQTQKSFGMFVNIFNEIGDHRTKIVSKSVDHKFTVESLYSPDKIVKINGPLVSVIMTAYMAEELLAVAVSSILNQTWTNLELIIVDDCSPDETFSILKELAKKDPRIKPIRMKRNGGTYVAKNEGLSKAKGEYVTFHDSDDWLHPNKIELQVNLLENREDIVACSTKYLRIDENSQILFHSKGAIRHACISLMIRADKVVGKIGFFDGVRVSADAEYEQRIRTTFGDDAIEEIPIPLLLASVRSESLSQGGKFALEWNGITGARLEYRASFENWHQNLSQENNEQYIPHPITKRKFPAPKEMIW
jgi:tetratricopeptide (TPR) repeat protein